MADTGKRRPKRKKRSRTVSIGGTSQSAFAGYAPKRTPAQPKKPDTDEIPAEEEAKGEAGEADTDIDESGGADKADS